MPRDELIAKSLSRDTYLSGEEKNASTTNDILNNTFASNKSKQCFQDACEAYKQYTQNLYVFSDGGRLTTKELSDKIDKHIKQRNKKPVVIIDYLQILQAENIGMSDKQAVDTNVLNLKQISKNFDIPVIAISSFNRESYYNSITMTSFKEAGSIEYSSDVLIGLQYKGMENGSKCKDKNTGLFNSNNEKKANGEPVDIELKILKNRNGPLGTVEYRFVAKYNCFIERQDAMNDSNNVFKGFCSS